MSADPVQLLFELASRFHREGKLRDAESAYQQVLQQRPTHAESIHRLGIIAHQVGKNDLAIDLIRKAISLQPTPANAFYDLGVVLRSVGRLDEAIIAWRSTIDLHPSHADAWGNLGAALSDKAEWEPALAAFHQALLIRPKFAAALYNLGNALQRLGRIGDAIAAYRQATSVDPRHTDAWYNLANSLLESGHRGDAIAAFREAIALRPEHVASHNNLGNALKDEGQLDPAISAYRDALALNPRLPVLHNNLGNALLETGRIDDAISEFRAALALDPDLPAASSNLLYAQLFHPDLSQEFIAYEHRRWGIRHARPVGKPAESFKPAELFVTDRAPGRRLRIGYVSADFRDHVVGRNLVPLFANHDRSQFEIFCYSQSTREDFLTPAFKRVAHAWRNIAELTDEQTASAIRADRIDILVDLAIHMGGNRLLVFARKPAPVQSTFAGYPFTTGLASIDYRLSDPYLDPPEYDDSIYTERTIRLPHSFWCYDPLEMRDVLVNALPAASAGFITFGCLNNFCKVNPRVLEMFATVLMQIEKSRLMLLAPPGSHRASTIACLQSFGVDPQRVEFVSPRPRREYLHLYHRIDIGLDTFPYNGHTTSLDSFWMGVPVVTKTGPSALSRAGASQLSNLGFPELIARSQAEFVDISTRLASDIPRLKELRQIFRPTLEQSPLMNASGFANDITAAFRQMWRTWCESAS